MDSVLAAGGRTPGLAVLRGPGGVGKSAVALRWLDGALDRFVDGQLYAELRQATGDPVAVEDVLGSFLRALGVPPDRVPDNLAERAALYRTVTADRSLAVLLEDAVSAAQVKALLPASGGSVVTVTTRQTLAGLLLDGATVVPVEPLDDASAMELLERHVGTDRLAPEHRPAENLLRLCAGLPIALCVAAALMILRPRQTVSGLVDDLRDERRRLEVLAVEDLSVRATFDLSYRGLPPRAARAYHVLGAHSGSLISPELVAAACRADVAAARQAVDTLSGASLLTEIDDRLYRCHDLVRAHARATATHELDREQRMTMELATLEWQLYVAQTASGTVLPARRVLPFTFSRRYPLPAGVTDHGGALAWLERHRLDLAAAISAATHTGWHELAYKLGDALQPLFILHKHHREAVEVNQLALDAALAWGDPDAENNMRKRLARVLLRIGDLDTAHHHIEEMLRITRERGDRHGLASALKSLGGLRSRRDDPDQAVRAFEQAAHLARELGPPRTIGLTLIDLGTALVDAGTLATAVTHLAEARALLSTLDPPDPYNAARAALVLGRAHHRLGDHDTARDLLAATVPVLESLGSDYELARTHETLAEVLDATGDTAGAGEHRRLAHRIQRPNDS